MTSSQSYKFSIIIPEYNCEKNYLSRCIESIKNQTLGFENIEIILVDDGSIYSTSKNIIKEYSEKFENIKSFFLDKNRGAGIARNIGIKNASSKYITFLDHDDYFYYEDYCEKMYNAISSNDVDFVKARYIEIIDNKKQKTNWERFGFNKEEMIFNSYKDNLKLFELPPTICATVYRKDFLIENDIYFKKYRAGEDNLFNAVCLFKAKGIMLLDTISIIYTLRHNNEENLKSITLTNKKNVLIDRLKAYKDIHHIFLKKEPKYAIFKLNGTINYWTDSHLVYSNLSFLDFLHIALVGHELFKYEIDNQEYVHIPVRYKELYYYLSKRKYQKSYQFYKKSIQNYKNFNKT